MQRAYRVPHPMISSRVLAPDEAANVFPVWRRSWNRRPSGSPASATHSGQRADRCDLLLAGPGLGLPAILGRSRIGFGNFMAGTRAVPSKAWGGLIRGNDGLIGDVDEPAGTGSMQFICVVPLGRDHADGRSEAPRRNARGALRERICLLP
jgi:hypothetical protein